MPNRKAACRPDIPPGDRCRHRSRKSSDSAFDVPAGPPAPTGVAKLGKAPSVELIFQKIFDIAIRFHPSNRPWCVRNRRRHAVSDESAILINLLKVKPGRQDALIALLKQTTDTVVRTLHGWKTTRLIAAKDGAGVVIYSEWETAAAVEAMRSDPRMKAYFLRSLSWRAWTRSWARRC
jgi:heme-degrading monooxygenase HmoA